MKETFSLQPQQVPVLEHFGFTVEGNGDSTYLVSKDGLDVPTHKLAEGDMRMTQVTEGGATLTIGWAPRKEPPAHPKTIVMGDITVVAAHLLKVE